MGLAVIGAKHHDVDRVVAFGRKALRLAQESASGYVARRLRALRAEFGPLARDGRVAELETEITLGQDVTREAGMSQTEGARVFREAWIAGVRKHFPGEPKPSYVTPWDDTPEWERQAAGSVYEQVCQFLKLSDGHASRLSR
ncbi:hypothetical protein GCM10010246_58080 [Streptomyces cuspidosporus]|uniref:PaaX-like C-terminal domain-containing protein n=1 Tax=Streptomyces cuspidosporus TaxID=66882 RepID=A0ABN3GT04_9ACTN